MAIGGIEDTTIERWLFDASQYKGEIRNLAKEIRDQNKLASDAALIQQKMAGSMDTTAKATAGMRGSMLAANLASAALMKGIGLLTGSIGSMLTVARNWEDHIGGNIGTVNAMSSAVDGMIGKLDLARAASLLGAEGFQLTERQLQAVSKAAIQYARINKTDFVPALEAVTNAVAAGTAEPLRKLGLDIVLTGDASSKTAQIVGLLEGKFGDLTMAASNTNEELAKIGNTVEDAWGKATSKLLQSSAWQETIKTVGFGLEWWVDKIEAFADHVDDVAANLFGIGQSPIFDKIAKARREEGIGSFGFARPTEREVTEEDWQKLLANRSKAGKRSVAGSGMRRGETPGLGPAEGYGAGLPGEMSIAMGAGAGAFAGAQAEMAAQFRPEFDMSGLAEYIGKTREAHDSTRAFMTAMQEIQAADYAKQIGDQWRSLGDALAVNVAGGFLQAADAAISGGQNFGLAILAMLKTTAMGLSSQMLAYALQAKMMAATLAINPATLPFAAAYAAQVPLYYAGAAALATVGIGLSVAGAAAGGTGAFASGGGGSAGGAGSGFRTSDRMGSASSFGERKRSEAPQPIVVEVYMGDKSNRAAAMQLEKQLTARIKKAS